MSNPMEKYWVPCCVYAIYDGVSEMPFYIGVCNDLNARMSCHKSSENVELRGLMKKHDKTLYASILSNHKNRSEGLKAEREAILHYKELGAPLVNRHKTKKQRDWTKPLNQQTL